MNMAMREPAAPDTVSALERGIELIENTPEEHSGSHQPPSRGRGEIELRSVEGVGARHLALLYQT